MKSLFTALLLFFLDPLLGVVHEIKEFQEVQQYIKKEQILIFDIDNTLIEPVQELGNEQWFRYRVAYYQKRGYDQASALERALPEWAAIQNITKVKLVEAKIPQCIKQWQNQGYTVMGLTTRGLGMATRTIEQLHSTGIDLSSTSPTQEEKFFMNDQGVLFRKGILFTAGSHKGKALYKFLSQIDVQPKAILFVDDTLENIKEIEYTSDEKQISFVGLRYGYLDEKVKNFRLDLADIQFSHFGHILSDDAAQAILNNSKQSAESLQSQKKSVKNDS